MLRVGLTGGIASGKSTVSGMFEEAGIPVICLDELARVVVRPGTEGLEEIRQAFGDEFITETGELDRERMGREVFGDREKRRRLEGIIHPRIFQEIQRRVRDLEREGASLVVEDVPLLYEIHYQHRCDCVVVVYVPREVQEIRLMERDGISREDARARLDAQMPIEEKRRLADYVVDNTGDIQNTRRQVDRIIGELKSRSAEVNQTGERLQDGLV